MPSSATLADKKHVPRFFAEFNRASGDQNPKDGTRGGFDPLFPSGHDKFGLADQFTWSNIVHARSGLQYKMAVALTISVAANSFWLTNQGDGLYNSSCKLLIASTGTQGNHIGWEPDLQAKVDDREGDRGRSGLRTHFPGGIF